MIVLELNRSDMDRSDLKSEAHLRIEYMNVMLAIERDFQGRPWQANPTPTERQPPANIATVDRLKQALEAAVDAFCWKNDRTEQRRLALRRDVLWGVRFTIDGHRFEGEEGLRRMDAHLRERLGRR